MVVGRKRVQQLMRTMGLPAIYRQPRTSRPVPEHRVCPYLGRARYLRHRRNPGTASRSQDQGPGHLPRCGTLQPPPTGQSQRSALDLPDVAGPHSLGRTPLGLAGAGTLGPVLPVPGTPPQKDHRLGPADDAATAPLAAAASTGAGGRQRLRRPRPVHCCRPSVNPLP